MTRTVPLAPDGDALWTVTFQAVVRVHDLDEADARKAACAAGFPRAHAVPAAVIRHGAGTRQRAAAPHAGGYRGRRDWEVVLQATIEITADDARQALAYAEKDLNDPVIFEDDTAVGFEIVEMRRC